MFGAGLVYYLSIGMTNKVMKLFGRYASSRSSERGFTVVEIVTIIIVMGILLGIVINSNFGYQTQARDKERRSDVSVIAQAFELYYRTNSGVTAIGPTYPSTNLYNNGGLDQIVEEPNATRAPDQTDSSLKVATTNTAQTPTYNQYIYQPLTSSGAICTNSTTDPCVRFRIYYQLETSDTVSVLDSMRQQ